MFCIYSFRLLCLLLSTLLRFVPFSHTHVAGATAYPYFGQAMTYYVPQTTPVATNNTTNANSNNNNDGNGIKAHIQSPHSIQPHLNSVAKTPLYASNLSNETKPITTPSAASQPNVFQYPTTMTSAPSTSSTSITNSTTTNATKNSAIAMTSVQSLLNTSVRVSSSAMTTNIGNDNPKLVSHINAGQPSHR